MHRVNNKGSRKKGVSIWKPLAVPFFRTLWITNVISLIGTWMHEVGTSWLMTSLTLSPFIVATVQTATTLPFFLLALPAGALADIIDRRRLLISTLIIMLTAASILGALTVLGAVTPLLLLILTFCLSFGASLNTPAWQSIIPELVDRDTLPSAITLGSVAFNIARVVGPAIGGFVVALFGPGPTFFLNALSFSGVLIALILWKHRPTEGTLPAERLTGAIKTGIRYIRNAPPVLAVLVHIGIFSFFASSLWAFLPIIARVQLGRGAAGFGMLLGFFGAGGLIGAMVLPRLQRRFSFNHLVVFSTALFAFSMCILAFIHVYSFTLVAMVIGGASWLSLVSTFSIAVQSVIPTWVRGRVISVFMLTFFGGMALGSALWGAAATWAGISRTIFATALCMAATIFFTFRYKISAGEGLDLTPSGSWPSLAVASQPSLGEGPVLVVVEYVIDPSRSADFSEAMRPLKMIRMRDGAFRWNLFRDVTNPGHYIESFIVESWAAYLRQQERSTISDREVEENVRSFHADEKPVSILHFIAEPVKKMKR